MIYSDDKFESFCCSVEGHSHTISNYPCQDSSMIWKEDDLHMCAVCDGHGGDRYFRSKIGAEIAIKIVYETVKAFVLDNNTRNDLKGIPFKSFGCNKDRVASTQDDLRLTATFDKLFRSIVSKWKAAITNDAIINPVNEWEAINVKPEYLLELKELRNVEKIYGCTLITYLQTKEFWFAFQIGDGNCIAFDVHGQHIFQPIPSDEKCFLNKTTSLCMSNAYEEFRFCCQGDGNFPRAVFMGTDGIDNTFITNDELSNFYITIAKYAKTHLPDDLAKEIEDSLPILSCRGSQDDMSIAFILDRKRTCEFLPELVNDQIIVLKEEIKEYSIDKEVLEKKSAQLLEKKTLSQHEQIDYHYTIQEIEKLEQKLSNSQSRLERMLEEMSNFDIKE